VVLLQIVRAYRRIPQFVTQETPNLLMLGFETWLPEHLTYNVLAHETLVHEYVGELINEMQMIHDRFYKKISGRCGQKTSRNSVLLVEDWV